MPCSLRPERHCPWAQLRRSWSTGALLSGLLALTSGCSARQSESLSGSGSETLGRYNRALVQPNGQVKACFDAASLTEQDRALMPQLNAKLHAELVERTGGAVNPFPSGKRALPFCRAGQDFGIRIYLFDGFDNRSERLGYETAARLKTPYPAFTGGRAAHNCSEATLVGPGKDQVNYKVSGVVNNSCVVVFTKVVRDRPTSKTSERIAGRISFLLLHEMLHAYGLSHEFERSDFDARSFGWDPHLTACLDSTGRPKSILNEFAEDSGKADPYSIMNYCSPAGGYGHGANYDQVKLSQGDVNLLKALYGKGASAKSPVGPSTDSAETSKTLPQETTPVAQTEPITTADQDGEQTCRQSATEGIPYSSGWTAHYVAHRSKGAWRVKVTATSRIDGTTMDWGEHEASEDRSSMAKFVAFLSSGQRMLEHRTPMGTTLTVKMTCSPP
jgi:hypothetical protein